KRADPGRSGGARRGIGDANKTEGGDTMHRHSRLGILGGALLFVAQASWGAVTAQRLPYHGWSGAYRLSNGTVDLVFVPQIGRIMRYGYVGGPNMLFENEKLSGKTTNLANPGKD